MHESAPVPAEAVPEKLRPLVAHGMAKYPAQRPPGAEQFVTLLEQLAAAFPAAALGVTGSAALGHGAAHLAAKVGAKGLFGKATGVKVGAGIATAAVAATTVYLVWPAPQHVGGATSGSLHMCLNQPGKIVPYRNPTVADSPPNITGTPVSPTLSSALLRGLEPSASHRLDRPGEARTPLVRPELRLAEHELGPTSGQ
ncbi:MAG: hypothetical protein ACRDP6_35080 [Actinoallomurus sp.]